METDCPLCAQVSYHL